MFARAALVAVVCRALLAVARPAVLKRQEYVSPSAYGKLMTPTLYETVNGTFMTDLASTNQSTFNIYAANNSFGLINGDWANFTSYVQQLNQNADSSTSYKVIFIARHGEGYHNTEQSYVGTGAWNCYWAQQDGNGTVEWADAELTPNGIAQAQTAHNAWIAELAAGAPYPQTWISSPLSRAASTLNITWSGLLQNNVPTFKELWRSDIGLQTCNHRRNATYLAATYPAFDFEQGFSNADELWGPVYQENTAQINIRIHKALDELFATNPNVFISVTAHSECIAGLLTTVNHITWNTQTGGMVPVLVKAVNNTVPISTDPGTSNTAPPCTTPVNPTATGNSVPQTSFNPNPSSIATTAPLSGPGVPLSPSASSMPVYTGKA